MREQLSAKYISNTEALLLLEKRWKELSPDPTRPEYVMINNTVKYLRLMLELKKCTLDKIEELDKFLQELGIEEEARVAIENICPTDVELLKVVLNVVPDLASELDDETLQQIVDKIKELLGQA